MQGRGARVGEVRDDPRLTADATVVRPGPSAPVRAGAHIRGESRERGREGRERESDEGRRDIDLSLLSVTPRRLSVSTVHFCVYETVGVAERKKRKTKEKRGNKEEGEETLIVLVVVEEEDDDGKEEEESGSLVFSLEDSASATVKNFSFV